MAVRQGATTTEVQDEARRVLATNRYLTLATADADGRPWATPLWFATGDGRTFFWLSRPGARHSRHLTARPSVGLTVFDSTAPFGEAAALYAEAAAEEVPEPDRAAALEVVCARGLEHGLGAWDEARVTGPAPFRLYRARATRVFVLDDRDGRVDVL